MKRLCQKSILFLATTLLVAIMLSTTAFAMPSDEFFAQHGPAAQEACLDRGYFPSVALAQAALESGWGESELARVNNLFGRKCTDQTHCVAKLTPEFRSNRWVQEYHWFAAYVSVRDAFKDYVDKYERPIYADKDFSSPQAFIRSVAGRYATDPGYAGKIISLIAAYDLEEWDE